MNATDTPATFRHGPLYFAGVAALMLGALAVGALFLVHPSRALTPVAQAPVASPSPSQAEQPAAAPVASVTPFQCSASTLSATGAPAVAAIDAVRTGSHPEYDRLVVQFSGRQPGSIELRPQPTSNFLGSPRGDTITLAGGHCLASLFRGVDTHTAYIGARAFKSGYPGRVEMRSIE